MEQAQLCPVVKQLFDLFEHVTNTIDSFHLRVHQHISVDLSCSHAAMSEQLTDCCQVTARCKGESGKSMAAGVESHRFVDARCLYDTVQPKS